jgi:hypothetical protein
MGRTIEIEDTDRKRALLLLFAGERVYDIYDAEKKDTAATFEAMKKDLGQYFIVSVSKLIIFG